MTLPVDDRLVTVIKQERAGEGVYALSLHCPSASVSAIPGQFVLIRDPSWGMDPLLMRPFAVAGVWEDRLEVVYRTVGRGTERLSRCLPGDELLLRGPVGRGFRAPASPPIYVAGTLGVAPLLFARQIFGGGRFILGVPDASWAPFVRWVLERCPEVEVFCDDGTIGTKGSALRGMSSGESSPILACGPMGMMTAMSSMDLVDVQVSLENRMACGIGACCGCVTAAEYGHLRVCAQGPVFDLKELRHHG
ncbi:MAG: dihydroorotate dehydrogenase [Dethiosulfovibrio peptidovorans]|nr:MAG: dihydroorotate dehydrogenase [Dethiosulfovibrio peptidovorans]